MLMLELLVSSAQRYSLTMTGETCSHILWTSPFLDSIRNLLCRPSLVYSLSAYHRHEMQPVLGLLVLDSCGLSVGSALAPRLYALNVSLVKLSCGIISSKIRQDYTDIARKGRGCLEPFEKLLHEYRFDARLQTKLDDPGPGFDMGLPREVEAIFTRPMMPSLQGLSDILMSFCRHFIDDPLRGVGIPICHLIKGAQCVLVQSVRLPVRYPSSHGGSQSSKGLISADAYVDDFPHFGLNLRWLKEIGEIVISTMITKPHRASHTDWELYLKLWFDLVSLLDKVDVSDLPLNSTISSYLPGGREAKAHNNDPRCTCLCWFQPAVMRAIQTLRASKGGQMVRLATDEWRSLIEQLGPQDSPKHDKYWSSKRHRDQVRLSILEAFRWISPEATGTYFFGLSALVELISCVA